MNAWELDFWGRVRSLKLALTPMIGNCSERWDAALENYLASDAAREAVTVSLIGQVANGYLVLRELDERIELTDQTIASRAESLRIFRRRYELGSTSKFDRHRWRRCGARPARSVRNCGRNARPRPMRWRCWSARR